MERPRRPSTGPVERLSREYIADLMKRLSRGGSLNREEQRLLLEHHRGIYEDNKRLRDKVSTLKERLSRLQGHLDALKPPHQHRAALLDWCIRRTELIADNIDALAQHKASLHLTEAIVGLDEAICAIRRTASHRAIPEPQEEDRW